MDKISSQLEPWILMMKHIDRRVMSLETMMCQNVQDMQGLKNRLDMVYVKQDRIQSTLAGDVPYQSHSFRSPTGSIDRGVAWSPSPHTPGIYSPPYLST